MPCLVGTHLSKLRRSFQIPLQATEGGIIVLEICARGLAAAAPQIARHVMRNVVVNLSGRVTSNALTVNRRWLPAGMRVLGTQVVQN